MYSIVDLPYKTSGKNLFFNTINFYQFSLYSLRKILTVSQLNLWTATIFLRLSGNHKSDLFMPF